MRIAIDARTITAPKTGDRTYCLNLVRGLAAVDRENDYTLCTATPIPVEEAPAPQFGHAVIPASPAWSWTPLQFPRALGRLGTDVAHVQYFIPPVAPCPVITTIHDISFHRHP